MFGESEPLSSCVLSQILGLKVKKQKIFIFGTLSIENLLFGR